MNEMPSGPPDANAFRHAIATFIHERKDAKLNGKEDAEVEAKYAYETWLESAARRVSQIQMVTHVLKATHPDARGSSLYVEPNSLPEYAEVGSHQLGGEFASDVVGNAAALDVYKLLRLEVNGRLLLDWIQEDNAELRSALHPDAAIAEEWIKAFSAIMDSGQLPTTHAKAKQIYWLAGKCACDDSQFQLLQPMFSSSLAHAVHADIQDARFGEENKAARKAFRDKAPHDDVYRNYRGLVVRKLGGTKPQNISQLNSERGGVNYLLSSLPPKWQSDGKYKFVVTQTAVDQLHRLWPLRSLTRELARFLRGDPPANDVTRTKRRHMEQELGAQLVVFAAEVRERMTPGWTRDLDCALPLCEQLWLDPERTELPVRDDPEHPEYAEQDETFNKAYTFGDWPDEVAGRFANWVNERLRKAGVAGLGDVEYRHWAKQAIVDAAWPIPLQRRALEGVTA